MAHCYKNEKLILDLHLQTGCKKDEIGGLYDGRLRIRIKAQPVEGKANRHLINYLASEFGVKKSDVEILKGSYNRYKTVSIAAYSRLPAWLMALEKIKPGNKDSVNK